MMFRMEPDTPAELWKAWDEAAKHGDIYIGDLTNRDHVSMIVLAIERLARDRNVSEVRLWINSGGGYLTYAKHIRDALMRTRTKGKIIRCHNCGQVSSAAVEIYLAGDIRTMADGAYFFVHSVGAWIGYMKHGEQKVYTEFLENVTARLAHWYADRTKKSAKFWQRLLENDAGKYIFEEEAAEWGILQT